MDSAIFNFKCKGDETATEEVDRIEYFIYHVSTDCLRAVIEFNCTMTVNEVSTLLTYLGIDEPLFRGDIFIRDPDCKYSEIKKKWFSYQGERFLLNNDIRRYNWRLSNYVFVYKCNFRRM